MIATITPYCNYLRWAQICSGAKKSNESSLCSLKLHAGAHGTFSPCILCAGKLYSDQRGAVSIRGVTSDGIFGTVSEEQPQIILSYRSFKVQLKSRYFKEFYCQKLNMVRCYVVRVYFCGMQVARIEVNKFSDLSLQESILSLQESSSKLQNVGDSLLCRQFCICCELHIKYVLQYSSLYIYVCIRVFSRILVLVNSFNCPK